MPCEPYREMLIDHIADELTDEETILLEQHLAECSECAAEERELRRTLEAAAPQEAGGINPQTEAYLLAAFHEQTAVETSRYRQRAIPGARESTENVWQRIARGSFSLPALRRPIPSYAALLLTVAAIGAGFWAGHSGRDDSFRGRSGERTRPVSRERSSETETLKDALAVMPIPGDDSLDGASSGFRERPPTAWFATAPSDAIWQERRTSHDTL